MRKKLLRRPTTGSLQETDDRQGPTVYYVNGLNRHVLNLKDYIKARRCTAQAPSRSTHLRCSSPCSPEGTVRHSSMCPCSNLRTSPPIRYPARIETPSPSNCQGQMLAGGKSPGPISRFHGQKVRSLARLSSRPKSQREMVPPACCL